MTYNVFGGTLSLTQSINQSINTARRSTALFNDEPTANNAVTLNTAAFF